VDNDGLYYFDGTETLGIPLTDAFDAGTHTIDTEKIILAASADEVRFPVRLPVGALVTEIRVRLQKNTSGSDEVAFDFFEISDGASSPTTLNASNDDNAPGNVTVIVTGDPVPIQALCSYYVVIGPSGSVAPAADRIFAVDVFWSKPAP